MMRELNKNEFLIVRRGMENAAELLETSHYKEALLELKKPARLLERGAIKTLMLARLYDLRFQAYMGLNQKEKALGYLKEAVKIADALQDTSEFSGSIRQKLSNLENE